MKYRLRKTDDPDIVDATKLKENKIIQGKYFGEYEASKGNWLVTYSNGKQEVFSEESFNKLFEPIKKLLLD